MKSLGPITKYCLCGIVANIVVGPLGFQTELDVNPKGEPNPSRGSLSGSACFYCDTRWEPRIVFYERGSRFGPL